MLLEAWASVKSYQRKDARNAAPPDDPGNARVDFHGRRGRTRRTHRRRTRNDASLDLSGSQGLQEIHTEDTNLGGYFVIAAPNLDAALAIARTYPHLKHGGTIVIRPIDPTPTSQNDP